MEEERRKQEVEEAIAAANRVLMNLRQAETALSSAGSWGQRVVRFYDLDKHIIEVGESMKMVINRFIDRGMTTEQISKKMDVSVADLKKLLND